MSKHNICTNFYSNYLYKGLALYYSLESRSNDFCLWILCMDEETHTILTGLNLKHAKFIRLNKVETIGLLKVKKSRNKAEYSWTLKSSFIDYLFKKYKKISSLFYLDGDVFFFNDINLIYNLIGNHSIAITPQRFPKGSEDKVKTTGIFNAGVIYIKRDRIGLKALERWRRQCIKWCYFRLEDGKLGDQMYLDEWPGLYKNLYQFQHPGVNLAPWNVNSHKISKKVNKIYVNSKPLIFYHFHQFKIFSNLTFEPTTGYYVFPSIIKYIYKPYEDVIKKIVKKLDKTSLSLRLDLEKRNKFQYIFHKVKKILIFLIFQNHK